MTKSLLVAVAFLGACSDPDLLSTFSPAPIHEENPIAGLPLYAQPVNNALITATAWGDTRPDDAAHLERIGKTAQAVWFNGQHSDIAAATSQYVTQASTAGALPVLVAYHIPQRDCGSYSAGGSADGTAYLDWVRAFARGIADRRAVIVLEPDALAGMNCLNAHDRALRTSLLADAIRILKTNARAVVYLDAGHPRWIDASEMARRLVAADVAAADGFSLNVSNFIWTAENASYGEVLSGLVGGKHFVIDTSRNGQGSSSTNEWCNPAGRGLGNPPTTSTGHSLIDALLWIKRPGESDGTCNGGPRAGAWWPDYALGLAQRATTSLAMF